jgi:hypothetical protein
MRLAMASTPSMSSDSPLSKTPVIEDSCFRRAVCSVHNSQHESLNRGSGVLLLESVP